MDPSEILHQVRVASPCSADWEQMAGDERVRFCGLCQKHVYNLSAMTDDVALSLVLEQEGELCARMHVRQDGTLISGNCPVGAERIVNRTKKLVASVVAIALFGVTSFLVPNLFASSRSNVTLGRSRAYRLTQNMLTDVKQWLGIGTPPAMVMGSICIPAPPVTPVPITPPPPPALPEDAPQPAGSDF